MDIRKCSQKSFEKYKQNCTVNLIFCDDLFEILYEEKVIGIVQTFILYNILYIDSLEIFKPYKKRGYGKEMVDDLIEFANNKNIEKISIIALENAVAFWEKCGFRETGIEPGNMTYNLSQ